MLQNIFYELTLINRSCKKSRGKYPTFLCEWINKPLIRLKRIYNFLMLHTCFYTICLVFRYTSWRFYVFSGTNLLTRCHSASSLFSAIFVFQKSYTEIFLELDERKAKHPEIYQSFQRTEEETKRDHRPLTQ
jgi:hypothetical protein